MNDWGSGLRYQRLISILAILSGSFALSAHPHTFIDYSAKVIIDRGGFRKIEFGWLFDEYFTESIVMDYDMDHSGVFEGAEIKAIYDEAFINVGCYNYFLALTLDEKPVTIDTTMNFSAEIQGDRMLYRFTVSLPETSAKQLTIMSYDPTFFVFLEMKSLDDLTMEHPQGMKCDVLTDERSIEFEMYGELPVKEYIIILGSSHE